MELTNDYVNRHFVHDDEQKYLGCVRSGSFASTAWVELDPYRTMTGRVEVLWSDDNRVANMDRRYLNRIPTVEKLWELINSGKYIVTQEFKDWLNNDPTIKITFFGLFRV